MNRDFVKSTALLSFLLGALLFFYRAPRSESAVAAVKPPEKAERVFNRYTGKVMDVLRDGPTLVILDGYRRTTRVRLLGAAETEHSLFRQRNCQRELSQAISGHIVEIELKEKDRQGYWRARLMRDGRDFNREELPHFCAMEKPLRQLNYSHGRSPSR